MSKSPFDYLNAINDTKENLIVDDISEKEYNAFMVNRGLSYFNDTVLFANEMNIHHQVDNRLQNDFLINIIRRKKRFSKWAKAQSLDEVEVIKQYYGYSNEKARQACSLLSSDQINILKKKVYKGGRK